MALMRAQARQLLFRLQGVCASADAALAGALHTADRTCTTLAAAHGALSPGRLETSVVLRLEGDMQERLLNLAVCPGAGHTAISANACSAQRSPDRCSSSLLQHSVRSAAAPLAAADSLLWTSYGVHSLRPAIAAVLSQPLATGDTPLINPHGAAGCTATSVIRWRSHKLLTLCTLYQAQLSWRRCSSSCCNTQTCWMIVRASPQSAIDGLQVRRCRLSSVHTSPASLSGSGDTASCRGCAARVARGCLKGGG